jgi:flagellar biosynthetic protein FliR
MIFVRVGAGVMIIPGIGESYVSPRFRLLFALMVALAMTPALAEFMPEVPGSPLLLTKIFMTETVIGLFIGTLARVLVATMHTAGMAISYQSSLAAATMFDISQAGQGSGIGNFLSVTTVVLIFTTDLHHIMLLGLFDSYTLFPPDGQIPAGDMSNYLSRLVSDIFVMGIKLSSPVIVIGLMIYLCMGVLSRLMPNMHVFFVIIPPHILISFIVLMATLSGMLLWYLDFLEARLSGFLVGF